MKTRNILIAVAIIIANISTIGTAIANDKVATENTELEAITSSIENSIKYKVTVSDSAEEVTSEEINRDTLEDLTAVPWMIKEVVVRPMKKNVKNANKNEVMASLAK